MCVAPACFLYMTPLAARVGELQTLALVANPRLLFLLQSQTAATKDA